MLQTRNRGGRGGGGRDEGRERGGKGPGGLASDAAEPVRHSPYLLYRPWALTPFLHCHQPPPFPRHAYHLSSHGTVAPRPRQTSIIILLLCQKSRRERRPLRICRTRTRTLFRSHAHGHAISAASSFRRPGRLLPYPNTRRTRTGLEWPIWLSEYPFSCHYRAASAAASVSKPVVTCLVADLRPHTAVCGLCLRISILRSQRAQPMVLPRRK
ncbi:hypothetical protein DENSPDRAFT_237190 [Dentipellis sp. KUC8613]|nr:hypothetical protein DENSPDRAFT_237190 [Dentipellis sp. KUC8613]